MIANPAVRRAVVLLGLAAACGLTLAAQPRQTFRTITRLIEVAVVVTDKDGKPVPGLTRADFTVEEDRQAQTISFFEVRDAGAAAAPAPRGSFRPATASGAFSNIVADGVGVTTVLLLDRQNASFASQRYGKQHIDRYLAAMRPGDRVALYALDGGIHVLHDFSSDAASLRRALDVYQARTTGQYDASTEPPPDGEGGVWLVDPAENVAEYFIRRRSIDTFQAMETLASHLAGIGGRKTVVWVSEAFALPTGLGRAEILYRMHRATEALSHAQAAVYPVDARGLVGSHSMGPHGRVVFNSMGMIAANLDTMGVMADDTGGRVFAHTNALDRSIARAVDDGRLTYVLGYYPSSTRLDGRFRRIDVKVSDRKLTLRHRAGYLASSAPPRDEAGRESLLLEALEAPLQSTGIGLTADITRDGGDVELSIRIDPAGLTLERDGTGWRGTADLLIAQVMPSGKGEVNARVPLAIALDDRARERALQDGLLIARRVRLQPNVLQLRIVARDVPTGRVGSLVIPARRLAIR
jgi:VWFA-related protein